MKILEIRQADLINSQYTTSDIEIIRALNNITESAHLIGIGNNKKNKHNFVTLFKAPLNHASLFQLKMLFYLPYYVCKRKIKIVIFDDFSVFSSIFLLLLRKILKILLILDIRTIPVENVPERRAVRFKWSCKFAAKYFDGASFITNGTKEIIESEFNIIFKKYTIWSSGVNINIFNPDIKKDTLKNQIIYQIRNKFVLFYHGSISENRGIQYILETINRLKDEISNILFISLSNNNQLIRQYCDNKNLKITDNLLLLDEKLENEEVPKYIKLADVCIVPLPRIEWCEISSPLKLMEYLAMEKPLILSNIKAHLEVVPEDSEFCNYFNPDIKYSLDKAIFDSFHNIENLKSKAFQGRELVKKKYTWDKQAKKLLQLFEGR